MFRRSFLGITLAALGGLAFGWKVSAAPAPVRHMPAHIERWLEELDSVPNHKMYFSVEKVEGREVWARCHF